MSKVRIALLVIAYGLPGCASGKPAAAEEPAVVSEVVTVPPRSSASAEATSAEPVLDEPRIVAASPEPPAEPAASSAPAPAISAPTAGSTPSPPLRDPATLMSARMQFSEGVRAYQQGRFADAKRFFEAAYAMAPVPQVLYNIASAEMRLGDRRGACAHYAMWVAQAAPDPSRLQPAPAIFNVCPRP